MVASLFVRESHGAENGLQSPAPAAGFRVRDSRGNLRPEIRRLRVPEGVDQNYCLVCPRIMSGWQSSDHGGRVAESVEVRAGRALDQRVVPENSIQPGFAR
jgi:hypothetical protein